MGKTVKSLIVLLALVGFAYGQTYKTVTADTNNAIRTNFSVVRSQVSDLSGASFAISNVTGLQSALDAKLATNGSAAGLTGFPAIVLQTNSSASLFPSSLLRTNGDGSGLTNLPNANLSNAIGVLPISNGGTGSTNASNARTALGLGSAATNPSSAFQPASSALTNLAVGDASGLTNIATTLSLGSAATNPASAFQPASATLTNLANNNGGSLTNVSVDLTTVLPSYSGNDGKVLAVATGGTNVAWTALSNTVTDASTLTNFPASILQTNSADGSFPAFLLRTNGDASGLILPASLLTTNGNGSALTNLTAANITGTVALASNISGTLSILNGGTGATTASNARVNLLPSYSGNASRVLALNSNATDLIWAVDGGGTVDLSSTNVTGTLPVSRGGTGATNGAIAMTNLGIYFTEGGGFSAVTLGENATMTSGSEGAVVIGQGANVNNNDNGIAIGRNAKATGSTIGEGIAIGVTAVVSNAQNAIQLGTGVNSTATTIQVYGWGTVNSTEWGYLANASSRGGYAMTNTNAISGSKSFVAWDGTNYTTNTVTISNGIITGWTP